MEVVWLVIGLVIGGVVGFFLLRSNKKAMGGHLLLLEKEL